MLNDRGRAEDVVQETLLRLWSQARRFRPERARLTTWLHNIAHNLCIDELRRESRQRPEEGHDDAAADSASPGDTRDGERREVLLRQAISALPERQRSALVLCHYQGLSNRQAAEILDVRVEALESLLARARRTLKKEFMDHHAS
jgi:RNA polymerase sigma-70 factor (ECF subfamily)